VAGYAITGLAYAESSLAAASPHMPRRAMRPKARQGLRLTARPEASPQTPDILSLAFRRFRVAQKLEVRFHDLRHTHATLMLKANVPLEGRL
jgi:integrase